jgi:SAM-dependent methyltransferase
VLRYAGAVGSILEAGAGTGKASTLFAGLGVPMTCVEPDEAMAAVLARRLAGAAHVRVAVCRFEDHVPDGPVDLLLTAQAWHWVDPRRGPGLAHAALRPGGTFAWCGHAYRLVDAALRERVDAVYRQVAPDLAEPAARDGSLPGLARILGDQMGRARLFGGVTVRRLHDVVDYPTDRYLRLMDTFSNHRLLEPTVRRELSERVAAVLDAHGGGARVGLGTVLALATRLPG